MSGPRLERLATLAIEGALSEGGRDPAPPFLWPRPVPTAVCCGLISPNLCWRGLDVRRLPIMLAAVRPLQNVIGVCIP